MKQGCLCMSKPGVTSSEWHACLIKDGWIKRLSVVAKDIVLYMLHKPFGRVAVINTEEAKDVLGRSKTTLIKGINELVAFGLVERLTGDLEKKAKDYLMKTHSVSGDILLVFQSPMQLSDVDKLILDDSVCRKHLLKVLMNEDITKDDFDQIDKKLLEVKRSGMSADVLWSGIYTRLKNVLLEKKESPRRVLSLGDYLAYLRPTTEQELKLVAMTLQVSSDSDTLGEQDWANLNPHAKRIIKSWEQYTGRPFLKREVELVNEALRYCLPAQVIAGIRRHCERATSFEYLMPMIRRGAFGKMQPRKTGGTAYVGTAGRAFSASDWQAERERLLGKAQAQHA